jgi:hypothetical protein
MAAKTAKESDIQKAILKFLHIKGVFVFKVHNTGIWDPNRKVFRTLQNSCKGIADILGILPDGRFLAIEVKTKSGRLSVDQKAFLENINRNNGVAFMARGIDDVIEQLGESCTGKWK